LFSDTTAEFQEALERKELRLLGLALAFLLLTAITLTIAQWSSEDALLDNLQQLVVLPIWTGVVWLVRRFARRANPNRDPFLLPIAFLLVGWGMLVVWRLAPGLGARQTGWFLVGSLAMIEVLRSSQSLGWLRRYRYLWLSAGLGLTALTLVLGTNPAGGEARLWLGCCGIYLQPSEPLRLLLIAFVASYLGDQLLVDRPRRWMRELLPLLLAAALSGLLLLAQRDLGAGMLFLAVLAFMIYIAHGHLAVLGGAGILLVAGGALGYATLGLVQTRLEAWINPWNDPSGAGFQIVQSVIAIASGGVFGAGPGLGAPGFVPVVQSDFVFSAVAEEWGLAGGLAMIGLFALLVARGLRTAARSRDPFLVFLSGGVSIAIALQVLLILGGATRLLPITGVTLPLISYGGSSLVTSLIAIGFLVLLSRNRPARPQAFSEHIKRTQSLLSVAWVACGLALGWWAIVRADTLKARTDNPRRALTSQESLRGQIVDRFDEPLAHSFGDPGSYQRSYLLAAAAPVTGYDSASFGQAGVESTMDAYLRGEIGSDPLAIWWHSLVFGEPPDGSGIRLSIAASLQAEAGEALAGRSAAAVVLDSGSGQILAMASSPSYDPNQLNESWSELVLRKDAPLLNRASQARYQPGMALAPLLYAWGNSNGLLAPLLPAPDPQITLEVSGQRLGCQRVVSPSGPETWSEALANVCAGPFAALGERLGARGLEAAADQFGLLDAPQIQLAVVSPSDPQLADVRLAAIGQGDLTVSPLQLARAYAVLAGAGVRPGLSLVTAVGMDGEWSIRSPQEADLPVVSPSAAQLTIDALHPYGAGRFGYEATALSGEVTVSWFIGFGTAGELVVVLLEDGDTVTARQIGLQLLEAAAALDLTPAGG
jgi:cell division protein FtsW (lipid II flippase)